MSAPYEPIFPSAKQLPTELVGLPNWVAWKLVHRPGKSRPDKVPVSPISGSSDGWHKPERQSTFEEARGYAIRNGLHGIGFVLRAGDGIGGVDLDGCRDPSTGDLTEEARAIVAEVDSYFEVSPGLTGVRGFFIGSFGGHVGIDRVRGIELYENGRFLTVTGKALDGTPTQLARRDLTRLGARFFNGAKYSGGTGEANAGGRSSDDSTAFHKVDLSTFSLPNWLYELIRTGDATPYGGDRSTAMFVTAKELLRAGVPDDDVASALADPDNGISAAALERRNGQLDSALRWVRGYVVGPARDAVDAEDVGVHGSGDASKSWPEPQPLTARLEPEPYPVDALPGLIGRAVTEVQAFVQAPLPLVACSALSVLSVAIQARFDVKRAEGLQGPVSLFLLVIADSGERKTTADGYFTAAIHEWEADQAAIAEAEQQKYRADIAVWEEKRKALLESIKGDAKNNKVTTAKEAELRELEATKPEEPRVPRLLLGDKTPEHLAWRLAKKWPSGGVISSEAGVVLGAHSMNRDSIMRNLGLLNVLWDGGTLSVGRKTSESFTVRDARLTVGLQTQEATLREFFSQSGGLARGTGFLARFLVAWPASTQGYRPFREPPPSWPALTAFNQRLTALLNALPSLNEAGGLALQLLELEPDARAAWIAFHDAVEAELRDGGDLVDVKDVASKAADNAARLAALFHVFEGGAGPVSLSAFESASRIVAWHLSESRRFFGELALPAELADAARLDDWLLAYCRRERTGAVAKNHVRQYGPLRDGRRLDAALRELAALGRARLTPDGRRTVIAINPALLLGGAAP